MTFENFLQSNSILSIDPINGTASSLQLSSIFENASEKISQVLNNKNLMWKMKPDLILSNNQLVFYTCNNNKIEMVDLGTMNAYTINLPFEIDSVLLNSHEKWLLQNTLREKFILEKSEASSPCPNILRKIDEKNNGSYKLGSLLNNSKNNLSTETLSKVLNQKIDSPNRIITTNTSYANIIVGFPELDSSNEILSFPRKQEINRFITPLITNHSHIIQSVPTSDVPKSALYEGKPHPGSSGYLEIVDPIEKKMRYIPVPR